jgi:hypothetical protein
MRSLQNGGNIGKHQLRQADSWVKVSTQGKMVQLEDPIKPYS